MGGTEQFRRQNAKAIQRSTTFHLKPYTSKMLRLLPTGPEPRHERQLVGAGTILLHFLLAWSLLRIAAVGGAGEGAGVAPEGTGKAMVVEFIALPSPKIESDPAPIPLLDPATSDQQDHVTLPDLPESQSDPQVDRALSDIGERVAFGTQSVSQSSSGGASLSASQGGNPTDDLLANYHGALRASIRRKWRELTSRPFPTGCTVRLDLAVGGPVNSASASGCDIPYEDRMQLEAAILMVQPLPYAGYESVFTPTLSLLL